MLARAADAAALPAAQAAPPAAQAALPAALAASWTWPHILRFLTLADIHAAALSHTSIHRSLFSTASDTILWTPYLQQHGLWRVTPEMYREHVRLHNAHRLLDSVPNLDRSLLRIAAHRPMELVLPPALAVAAVQAPFNIRSIHATGTLINTNNLCNLLNLVSPQVELRSFRSDRLLPEDVQAALLLHHAATLTELRVKLEPPPDENLSPAAKEAVAAALGRLLPQLPKLTSLTLINADHPKHISVSLPRRCMQACLTAWVKAMPQQQQQAAAVAAPSAVQAAASPLQSLRLFGSVLSLPMYEQLFQSLPALETLSLYHSVVESSNGYHTVAAALAHLRRLVIYPFGRIWPYDFAPYLVQALAGAANLQLQKLEVYFATDSQDAPLMIPQLLPFLALDVEISLIPQQMGTGELSAAEQNTMNLFQHASADPRWIVRAHQVGVNAGGTLFQLPRDLFHH
jgi:hypothetical protein